MATTDDDGHYQLNRLRAGKYTIVAWPQKGKPIEKEVEIPAKDGDYDIEM
jgi:hypothetical protein